MKVENKYLGKKLLNDIVKETYDLKFMFQNNDCPEYHEHYLENGRDMHHEYSGDLSSKLDNEEDIDHYRDKSDKEKKGLY